MCLSMFSGVSLAKAYSPLTARELSSGEHAQRQAEGTPQGLPEAKVAHAERKAEEEQGREGRVFLREFYFQLLLHLCPFGCCYR